MLLQKLMEGLRQRPCDRCGAFLERPLWRLPTQRFLSLTCFFVAVAGFHPLVPSVHLQPREDVTAFVLHEQCAPSRSSSVKSVEKLGKENFFFEKRITSFKNITLLPLICHLFPWK